MQRKRKEILISFTLILFLSLGIGYAYLSTELTLAAKVKVKKRNCDNISDLYQRISCKGKIDNAPSEFVSSSSGIDFAENSSNTNGKGIYIRSTTENDLFPIKYYRGDVTDNNVKFANYCWKIVRTTETGGIKLIYNGIPESDGSCNNMEMASQPLLRNFNTENSSPADIGYMYGTRYDKREKNLSQITQTYIYGNDIMWNGSNYTLVNTKSSSSWSADRMTLAKKYHYTCFNENGNCTTVYYIYYFGNSSIAYYLELTGGDDIETAKNKMFANTNDSEIKEFIDNWYETEMIDYTKYLQNAVWCNDRTLYKGALKGKDEDAGNDYSYFGSYESNIEKVVPRVICSNKNDSFTVKDEKEKGNGALKYPVGLLTADEMTMAGHSNLEHSNSTYLNTEEFPMWSMSPMNFNYLDSKVLILNNNGGIDAEGVSSLFYVRPSVVLQHGIILSSGNGTGNNPYILKLE